MLELTNQARDVIRRIPSRPALPASAGLRIAVGRGSRVLRVGSAAEPRPGDVVAGDDDARVFLDRTAAVALRDRMLDVVLGRDGRWHFQCASQS